jgi:hypothetical protein
VVLGPVAVFAGCDAVQRLEGAPLKDVGSGNPQRAAITLMSRRLTRRKARPAARRDATPYYLAHAA